MNSNPETRRHMGRFLVAGSASVIVDLVAYYVLVASGVPSSLAKAASYVAGMLLGFVLNKRWTFHSNRSGAREVVVYVAIYVTTLCANVAINAYVLEILANHPTGHIANLLAFLAATGTSTVLNYLGLRGIVFRRGIRDRREHATKGTP